MKKYFLSSILFISLLSFLGITVAAPDPHIVDTCPEAADQSWHHEDCLRDLAISLNDIHICRFTNAGSTGADDCRFSFALAKKGMSACEEIVDSWKRSSCLLKMPWSYLFWQVLGLSFIFFVPFLAILITLLYRRSKVRKMGYVGAAVGLIFGTTLFNPFTFIFQYLLDPFYLLYLKSVYPYIEDTSLQQVIFPYIHTAYSIVFFGLTCLVLFDPHVKRSTKLWTLGIVAFGILYLVYNVFLFAFAYSGG